MRAAEVCRNQGGIAGSRQTAGDQAQEHLPGLRWKACEHAAVAKIVFAGSELLRDIAVSAEIEMTRVRRIDHVLLAMPAGREDDARAFYHEILGIPEVVKPPQLAARGGCWFEAGELKVHLGVEQDFAPARKAHPAFIVDDLQALMSNLKQAGYKLVEDAALQGYDRIFVDDPFGNRIELMQPKAFSLPST
jgi:catechol 2,3-dioxygenase-like lactoylglutathione lyase family enzyme